MYSDEEMKNILELKEQMLQEIEEYETKLEYRKRHLELLDSLLRTSSFAKASSMAPSGDDYADASGKASGPPAEEHAAYSMPPADPDPDADEGTLIRRDRTGETIASIDVAPDRISITLNGNMRIKPDAPPFQGFFLDEIIGDMRKRDDSQCREGELDSQNAISCEVLQNGPFLHQIIIRNYRDEARLSKIKSSIGWTLSRMMPQDAQ